MVETRIIRKVELLEYKELIDKYKDRIKVSSHAHFRLNEMQRKVYKEEVLIELLTKDNPAFVGIQKNKNYAAFFKKKNDYLRLIFKVAKEDIEIITFYITNKVPNV